MSHTYAMCLCVCIIYALCLFCRFFYGHSVESWQYNGIALLLILILGGFVQLHSSPSSCISCIFFSLSSLFHLGKKFLTENVDVYPYIPSFLQMLIFVSRESWRKNACKQKCFADVYTKLNRYARLMVKQQIYSNPLVSVCVCVCVCMLWAGNVDRLVSLGALLSAYMYIIIIIITHTPIKCSMCWNGFACSISFTHSHSTFIRQSLLYSFDYSTSSFILFHKPSIDFC